MMKQLWRYAAMGLAATVLVGVGLTVLLAHLLQQSGKERIALPSGIERPMQVPEKSSGQLEPAPPETALNEPAPSEPAHDEPLAAVPAADAPPSAIPETPEPTATAETPPSKDSAPAATAQEETPAVADNLPAAPETSDSGKAASAVDPAPSTEAKIPSLPEQQGDKPPAAEVRTPAATPETPKPDESKLALRSEDNSPHSESEAVPPAASSGEPASSSAGQAEQHAAVQSETLTQTPVLTGNVAPPLEAAAQPGFACPASAAEAGKLTPAQLEQVVSKCPADRDTVAYSFTPSETSASKPDAADEPEQSGPAGDR